MTTNNYEKKYKLLVNYIKNSKRVYKVGDNMGLSESVNGVRICSELLEYVDDLDKEYKTD